MKINYIHNSFTHGEFSPRLYGRTDIKHYFSGLEKCENFVLKPYGGIERRPGSYYVGEVKTSSKTTRLIPFQYSTTQAYIIEMGDQYMRFYKNNGQITSSGSAVEIATPYTEDQVFDVQFAQSADTLYIAHPNHAPRKLTRSSHTSWSLDTVSFTGGPYTTGSASAWSAGNGYPACVTFYEQRLFFANTSNQPQTVWGSVSNSYEDFTAGANDDDSLEYTLGSGQINAIKWMMPGKVMALGTAGGSFTLSSGSDANPLTPSNVVVRRDVTYGSDDIVPVQIGNFVYFVQRNSRTLREFGYSFEVDSYQALDMTLLAEHITEGGVNQMEYQQSPNDTLWCVTGKGNLACLEREIPQEVIGWFEITTDGDYESVAVIPAGEEDEVWTIVNRTIDGSTKRYIEYFKPFAVEDEQEDCFYVDCGLSLDTAYSISSITQADPAVVTTSSAHGLSNGDTVIIRNVNGMTEVNKKRYLAASVTSDTFELQDLSGDDIDSSSYVAYSSSGEVRKCVDTLSGLSHLEGETVSVLADGAVHPDCTVTSGAISLNWKAGEVHVGLPYNSIAKTLRLEGGSQMGSAQAVVKRITDVTVRMYKSLGCKVGTEDSQDIIPFRDMGDALDEPTPLYTGDKKILMPDGYNKEGQIYIKQDQPLPLNITAIISKVSVIEA